MMLMKDFASGNEFPMMTLDNARRSLHSVRLEMNELRRRGLGPEEHERLILLRRASRAIIMRWPELAGR